MHRTMILAAALAMGLSGTAQGQSAEAIAAIDEKAAKVASALRGLMLGVNCGYRTQQWGMTMAAGLRDATPLIARLIIRDTPLKDDMHARTLALGIMRTAAITAALEASYYGQATCSHVTELDMTTTELLAIGAEALTRQNR